MSSPFVLLHPLGADRHFWNPVRTALGQHHSIALDLPGHGGAAALPAGTGIEAYSTAVAYQIAKLGTPVHLVGMSLGGLVAQYLAARRPALVASAYLVDTVPSYPQAMQQMWHDRAHIARTEGLATLVDPMVAMWFTAELADAGDTRVLQACNTFRATDPEGYARCCELLAGADLRELLTEGLPPTVVVCGEDDAPPFKEAAEWMARATGSEPVYWLPGKHACAIEHPDRFAAVLLSAVPAWMS